MSNVVNRIVRMLGVVALCSSVATARELEVSGKDARYFEDAQGKTFVPVGCNLCFYRNNDDPEQVILDTYRKWMENFAANGGNYMRIWLGVPFFNVMPERIGEYDEKATGHIRYIIQLAEKLNIKVKFTLEHFRYVTPRNQAESFPGVVSFCNPVYNTVVKNMRDYFASDVCKKAYLDKARYLASQGFGKSKAVVAWELWNEINSVTSIENSAAWSDYMIAELQKIFPDQMILQNLGSFSEESGYRIYDYLGTVKDNAFMQVHRYLDPGAQLDVCRASMDVIAADSVRELRDRRPDLPAIVAEIGAVEAHHARYSDLYEKDSEGTLLHDMIFAPFFAGSAGCGQPWHWDRIYISKHNLWHHFKRFANAIEGVDPVAENFKPFYTETKRLRIYGLKGRTMELRWCRDKKSGWQSELKDGVAAEVLGDQLVNVGSRFTKHECYLPWEDKREGVSAKNGRIMLPAFKRSIVIKSY